MNYLELDQTLQRVSTLLDPSEEIEQLATYLYQKSDGWQYILSCFDSDSWPVGELAARIAARMLQQTASAQRTSWSIDICNRLIERRTSSSLKTWNWIVRSNAVRAVEPLVTESNAVRLALVGLLTADGSPKWIDVAELVVQVLARACDVDPQVETTLRMIEEGPEFDIRLKRAVFKALH